MISQQQRASIISLINREVVPAVGCTEPMAVALCVARATELLGSVPEHIEAHLSDNILKNAMGVGIPGTGMIGLPIAIALGALIGRSEYGLEVLRDVTPEAVARGREYMREHPIEIRQCDDAPCNLHIDITVSGPEGKARAVISREHTRYVFLSRGDEVILDLSGAGSAAGDTADTAEGSPEVKLDMATVYEFATTAPLEEIDFILRARDLNMAAAETALKGDYGHSLGVTLRDLGKKYYGDTPLEHMISYTCAACDARMGGATVSVMSNSGSGNQGITATLPVVSFARDCGASDEQTVRALILSHLTCIYIKQSLGRLSALCGAVVASTGSSAAITYLMGGDLSVIGSAVKNMIANLTGMICDGAKPSCALKISSGVASAMMSALLAMNNRCVTSSEGIVCDDVDRTIRNLTVIGCDAMRETDRRVLQIMTSKGEENRY